MSIKSKKITIIVDSLRYGGAGRQALLLSRALTNAGYRVSVIPFTDWDLDVSNLNYDCRLLILKPALNTLSMLGKVVFLLQKVYFLKRIFRRENSIVISYLTENNCIACLAGIGLSPKLIVCERNYLPEKWAFLRDLRGRLFYNLVVRLLYRFSSIIVAQTMEGGYWLRDTHKKSGVAVIPNFLSTPQFACDDQSLRGVEKRCYTFAYLGSFSPQKRVGLLVTAFEIARRENSNIHLLLAGSGAQRASIEALVVEKGLESCVSFLGQVSDVANLLAVSDALVLPSAFEGFPNVLQEAMLAGLPCIAFDVPTGPRELFECSTLGQLLPGDGDEYDLGEAMAEEAERVYADSDRRAQVDRIRLKYDSGRVLRQWRDVIESV